jgi:hypothetical protein
VDDATATGRTHRRDHELGHADQAEHVRLELAADVVHGQVFEEAVQAVAGVVDQDVDVLLAGEDVLRRPPHGGLVGDVELHRG